MTEKVMEKELRARFGEMQGATLAMASACGFVATVSALEARIVAVLRKQVKVLGLSDEVGGGAVFVLEPKGEGDA